MFNFLFEGTIGELLAPNSQSPLFNAIQKNEQDVIQNMIATASTVDICRIEDCGYSAVHAACRYNNLFALQLIFSRGVHCEQPDRNGSTPLHYASKYGHIDLCKHLVERGAFPARKNNLNQTPYDLAESHIVRQYLLPLQFNAERIDAPQAEAPTYNYNSTDPNRFSAPAPPQSAYQPPQPQPSYQPQPQLQPSYPPQAQSQSASAPAGFQALSHAYVAPPALSTASGVGAIQPDGFGSSASDPSLQAKYGHVKEVVNIAPPPIMAAPPSQYSAFNGNNNAPYSRYVPYDVNAPPQPLYASPQTQPMYGMPPAPYSAPMQQQFPSMQPPLPAFQQNPPAATPRTSTPGSTTQPLQGSAPPVQIAPPTVFANIGPPSLVRQSSGSGSHQPIGPPSLLRQSSGSGSQPPAVVPPVPAVPFARQQSAGLVTVDLDAPSTIEEETVDIISSNSSSVM